MIHGVLDLEMEQTGVIIMEGGATILILLLKIAGNIRHLQHSAIIGQDVHGKMMHLDGFSHIARRI